MALDISWLTSYDTFMEDENRLLTIKEIAKFLGVSIAQVYRYARQENNQLPLIRISESSRRIQYKDLLKWVEEQVKL
jgi:excisionase family DNA binding protein